MMGVEGERASSKSLMIFETSLPRRCAPGVASGDKSAARRRRDSGLRERREVRRVIALSN